MSRLIRQPVWLLMAAAIAAAQDPAQRQDPMPACMCSTVEGMEANREALAAHGERSLKTASEAYSEALKLQPARAPNAAEAALILRFSPRFFTHPQDPFPLKDAAAILHPNGRWIAYHVFWEDDIDFPDDNDPCDHELLWVQLNEARTRVAAVYTYFHGRILRAPADTETRPRVLVQWGKHGTMPWDWRGLPIVPDSGDLEGDLKDSKADWLTLEAYNRATWKKLSTYGRASQESPLARGWPFRFEGTWEDFIRFEKPVDLVPVLKRTGLMVVSCWNNAALNRHLLRYNFAAKTEWPEAMCERPAPASGQ